jgi:hypothetical protein
VDTPSAAATAVTASFLVVLTEIPPGVTRKRRGPAHNVSRAQQLEW